MYGTWNSVCAPSPPSLHLLIVSNGADSYHPISPECIAMAECIAVRHRTISGVSDGVSDGRGISDSSGVGDGRGISDSSGVGDGRGISDSSGVGNGRGISDSSGVGDGRGISDSSGVGDGRGVSDGSSGVMMLVMLR